MRIGASFNTIGEYLPFQKILANYANEKSTRPKFIPLSQITEERFCKAFRF